MRPHPHHITVGGDLWCDWTGSSAGQDINARAGCVLCGHQTAASAASGAKALRRFFRRGSVKVVAGPCPSQMETAR